MYADFAALVRRICPDLLLYFDQNWKTCVPMWSKYARSKHFSAGNTTTNRIESHWNQLKMLLGRKTRLDKSVAGILDHQVTILRQLNSGIVRHATRTRVPDSVPDFLAKVADRLSDFALSRVRMQYENFVALGSSGRCTKTDTYCEWEVLSLERTSSCHDLQWTCDCSFFATYHLPCQHLMIVAKVGHKFSALPAPSIEPRWCMLAAQGLQTSIESLVEHFFRSRGWQSSNAVELQKQWYPVMQQPYSKMLQP